MKHAIVVAALVFYVALPSVAHAAPPDEGPDVPPDPGCEGELADYARTGDFKLLYDIGSCLEARGNHVRAAGALKHYLDEGGQGIPEERRTAVEKQLATLQPRIARVTVSSNVAGIEVRIDGSCAVDETTYESICTSRGSSRVVLVDPGERRLTVKHLGYLDVAHVMTLNAGENVRVLVNAASLAAEINPYREPMWTAWAVSGGALVAGTVIGIRTAVARDGFESPTGIATIALGAGALVAAGIATFFTVRTIRWRPTPSTDVALDVLGLRARF